MQGKKSQGLPFSQYTAKYIGLMIDLVHHSDISEIKILKGKTRNTRMIKDNENLVRIAYPYKYFWHLNVKMIS